MANKYIINTFASQRDNNVESAITYYEQKTNALLSSLENSLVTKMLSKAQSMQSINEVFEEKINEISNKMSSLETFMSQKNSGLNVQSKVQEYNMKTQALDKDMLENVDTIAFLKALSSSTMEFDEGIPETIDLSGQSAALQGMAEAKYQTASAAGGARARIFGEIAEQIILNNLNNGLNEIFSYFQQTGKEQTMNWAGLTQGKADGIFATMDIKMETLNTGETVGIVDNNQIFLDLAEALDLEGQDITTTLNKYLTGGAQRLAGVSIKQWADKNLGSRKATIAHAGYTADLIRSRFPDGKISKKFKSKDTFSQYMQYVVSRFLINIIGVYNVLMANASGVSTTANWLRNIYAKGYALQHTAKLENGIWNPKDNTVYVGRKI